MKVLKIASCYVKKYRPKCTSASDNNCVNHLKNMVTIKPFQHIVTDITYIYTKENKWVYLLTFLDAYTRKVLHFALSKSMVSYFVDSEIKEFLLKYPQIKLIHSDRGSQFTARSYQALLKKFHVTASYSAKGYPYDNAIMESYHAALKIEKFYRVKAKDFHHAYRLIFQYNYGFYNNHRIHQSLGYLTPQKFENLAFAS